MDIKKKYKKRNNLTCKKGWWYYRLCWGTGGVNHKEKTIPLKTKDKSVANRLGKKVDAIADDVRNGIYQEHQIKDLLPWLNPKGTSEIVDKSLQDTINEYLEYRSFMVKPKTLKRDKSALNQLMNFIGYTKPVEELSYRDIEGANGLIQHLRNKGCSDVGINTSLRHIKVYFNWLFEKEKIISEPIKFKLIPKGVQLYHYFNELETNQIYHYIDENGIDSFFKRCFHFYNQTGMRPTEPFIGELVGDWYIITAEERKNKIPMQMQLNDELKAILLEMQSYRDSKLHCKDANERVCDIFSRTLNKIVTALGLTGKRLTLYSFRHSFAIRRITMTNGNIYDVMRDMGHSNPQTTMGYLRFPQQRRLDDFPSLKDYITNQNNMPKNMQDGNKKMGTQYLNIPNLLGSSDA